jgi:hypothetical protein
MWSEHGGVDHGPAGDLAAVGWLQELAARLRVALAGHDDAAALRVVEEADISLRMLLSDENPRTRAQVRGFLMVSTLVRRGARNEAVELLEGELHRSFPGNADLDPNERDVLE